MSAVARTFALADQLWFSQVSGDANPLHVDPMRAATTYPGSLVVHGMHAFLWGLDSVLSQQSAQDLEMIQATFIRPIVVGDDVVVDSTADGSGMRLMVQGEPMVVARWRRGPPPATGIAAPGPSRPAPSTPVEREFDALTGLEGTVSSADSNALAARFPSAVAAIGPAMLAGLATLSTLVGMDCPGLRSLFSEFKVARDDQVATRHLAYRVKKVDPVFSRVDMEVSGLGLAGMVSAFAGRPDVPPSDDDIGALVAPGEFAGDRPLVVGATGGLGAVTARLLAAGGAAPVLTWHQTRSGAEATACSVAALGGRCDLVQLDACSPESGLADLAKIHWAGEQIYYFATPRIFRRHLALYQGSDLRTFLDVYVDGFYQLVCGLLKLRPGARMRFFYPSTVAAAQPTADLLEYGMAKLAGEHLCARLQEKYKTLSISVARLPRIATRQTASFIKVPAERPEHVMLPIVRALQGKET